MRSALLATLALLASTSLAHATTELKNDGFVSGGSANFQSGFVAGEAGAVRFEAPAADRQLQKIQLLFGGAATTQTLTLMVFDDTAGTAAPGGILFMGDFELTGSDTAMQELDVTAANILVTAKFRIAIVFQHAGAPTIASDADATIAADKNFILVNGTTWKRSSDLGVTGDWVIRAFISDGTGGGGPTTTFCDTDPDCPAGEYCDAPLHACTSDCHTSSDCSGGGSCTALGHCEGGSSSGGDGGCRVGGGGGGGGEPAVAAAAALALIVLRRRRAR